MIGKLLVLVAVGLTSVHGQIDCSTLTEQTCEQGTNGDSCYWAFQFETPRCKKIPNMFDSDCRCMRKKDGEDDCEPSNEPGRVGSGCEPKRFCAYSIVSGCAVVNVVSDDSCVLEYPLLSDPPSDTTGVCAPTDYCEYKSNGIPLLQDGDCVRNGKTSPPLPSATKQPTARQTSSPSALPTRPVKEEETNIVPILGGVGGGLAMIVGATIVYCCCVKGSPEKKLVLQDSDTPVKNLPLGVLSTPEMAHLPPPPTPSTLESQSVGSQMKLVVQFDFEGENDDELTVREGAVLDAIHKVDAEWWEARDSSGKVGIIPSSYVKIMSISDQSFVLDDFEEPPDF